MKPILFSALFTGILVIVERASGFGVSSELICTVTPVDIVFVLDSSTSIWGPDFKKELEFVSFMVNKSDIGLGPKQVRVGVEIYSDRSHIKIHLKDSVNKNKVNKKIRRIRQIVGTTNTADALNKMRKIMFQPKQGSRPNVQRVGILITDGESDNTNKTQKAAKACRDADIKLFAIGIGDSVIESELKGIASKPTDTYFTKASNFTALKRIRDMLALKTCNPGCKNKKGDVFFLSDSSSSIQMKDFEQQKRTIESVINKFLIGAQMTRIGVAMFSDEYRDAFDFNSGFNKSEVLQVIRNMTYMGGATDLFMALQEVERNVFNSTTIRAGAERILIIFTDGMTINSVQAVEQAQLIRKSDVKIFVITGKSPDVNQQVIKGIASKPPADFLHTFATFEKLLSKLTCKANNKA